MPVVHQTIENVVIGGGGGGEGVNFGVLNYKTDEGIQGLGRCFEDL